MRLTLPVIKADVGSVGGHTKPSARILRHQYRGLETPTWLYPDRCRNHLHNCLLRIVGADRGRQAVASTAIPAAIIAFVTIGSSESGAATVPLCHQSASRPRVRHQQTELGSARNGTESAQSNDEHVMVSAPLPPGSRPSRSKANTCSPAPTT